MRYELSIRPLSQRELEETVRDKIAKGNYDLSEQQTFEEELSRLQVVIDRHRASMEHAQAIYDKVETLKNISFDFIQHNNGGWKDLVSEFKNGETHGGSTPAWHESANAGLTGEWTKVHRS